MNDEPEQLIITRSFNGLLDRIAKIDRLGVWLTGKKILKKAKKDRIEATMRISEVLTLTGLTRKDVEFFVSLGLISVVNADQDPLLSARDAFSLVRIFERMLDQGIICTGAVF